ncbi:HalOD1 output domain-containing protein [Natronorubrum sp. A-ect3]|uniref:HalOD1 output domain-containing protein n=1 Tax=Natronorubrum sp. A-ect3 TaxID=3242698 RepID=UPI00359DC859
MSSTGSSKRDGNRDSVTDAIVTAVADAKGVDVLELPPLWEVVNPDALETAFSPSKRDRTVNRAGQIAFSYCGYRVLVEYGDSVTVSLES